MARRPKRYSIAHLLNKQTAGFRKHPKYPELIYRFNVSPVIKRIRITSRCYRILNNATVPDKNLTAFYRTYRLPKDKFFNYFLEIKQSILSGKKRRKKEKAQWIKSELKKIPIEIRDSIAGAKEIERHLHPRGKAPVWDSCFVPKTKKHTKILVSGDIISWQAAVKDYAELLQKRYRIISCLGVSADWPDILCASIVLGIVYDPYKNNAPKASLVRSQFRSLSKLYHPDTGGNPVYFVEVKKAKEQLIVNANNRKRK